MAWAVFVLALRLAAPLVIFLGILATAMVGSGMGEI